MALVSGAPQYHYARMIGFPDKRIALNLLSADDAIVGPASGGVKRFVFVGRFDPVKGLDLLTAALERVLRVAPEWSATIIGDGQLRGLVEGACVPRLEVLPYLQPSHLGAELSKGGVGVLPSVFESWGVSLHEMALAGLPLIASSRVGAASEFLIDGYNGFLFRSGDPADLEQVMLRVVRLSDEHRSRMGSASLTLGQRIRPSMVAAALLSAPRRAEL